MKKAQIKITVERAGLWCKFGRKRFNKYIIVYCNFNPANYPLFLDSLGGVQRAGMYDDIRGFAIVEIDKEQNYGEFSERIGDSLLMIK